MPTSQQELASNRPEAGSPKELYGSEPIRVAAKVRPLSVAAPTGEIGYPLPLPQAVAAMSLDSPGAKRHTVRCVEDDHLPISQVALPLPQPDRYALLSCRHARLGAACAPGMQNLPDELWERIFTLAAAKLDMPNAIEFGDPPKAVDSPRGRFHCGLALDATVPQATMYETLMVPLVESCLDGFSTALVTFGPRGSGKSHTLEGPPRGSSSSSTSSAEGSSGGAVASEATSSSAEGHRLGSSKDDEGLMRKALRHTLIELHRRHGPAWSTTEALAVARFSCYAVHKRVVYDMLTPEGPTQRKIVRTDRDGGRVHGYVEGLHAPPVSSLAGCDALLETARVARHKLPVCPACANWTRELDLFWTLHVKAGPLAGGSLSFVKLAGHDRRQRCNECRPLPTTGMHGHTNAISVVLSALADNKTKYVPYRDSPTTELMQEMLGGRAKVAWLAHVVPGPEGDFDETVATLKMTQYVNKVRNLPQRLPHGLSVAEHAAEAREIEELQGLLRSGPSSRRAPGTPNTPSLAQRAMMRADGASSPPELS